MDIKFIDTTFRDGSQSLWASGMRSGMMTAVAEDLDKVGFDVVEVPANAIYFKKIVRDLKEDPWELMRALAEKMPNTPKGCMGGTLNLNLFGAPTPVVLGKLFFKMLSEMGVLDRVQCMSNTQDQIARDFPELFATFDDVGLQKVAAICYSISPRHTDEHFAERTRQAVAMKPDVLYIKDQGGLLTVDRIRTLAPLVIENAGGIPVELHSHCSTGVAPLVYMEALDLGIDALHTGIPPLADGSAQPSVFQTAANAVSAGHSVNLDLERLQSVSDRLMRYGQIDGLPVGAPVPYDRAQYVHQIPGGVISNLTFQLKTLGLQDRMDEVIEESVRVRADLGYPMMITPHSQYVCTQAALNVNAGERYKVVLDELLLFATGRYGEDSGYTWMDENLRDRLLANPRTKELTENAETKALHEMSLKEARAIYGGAGVSDEEMLLRAMMQGEGEIKAMRQAGPARSYDTPDIALLRMIERFDAQENLKFLSIEKGNETVRLHRS